MVNYTIIGLSKQKNGMEIFQQQTAEVSRLFSTKHGLLAETGGNYTDI